MPAGLVFIWWVLRQEPLNAMGFRFRRSAIQKLWLSFCSKQKTPPLIMLNIHAASS